MLESVNPFAYLARRWQPSLRVVRWAAFSTVVMNVVIVVTGGAVRLTDSGLGCPTWPKCTSASLTPTSQMGIHGVIEFSNRMLTYVLCAAVGAAILAARSRSPRRRDLTRLAWGQFWMVMSNAVVGGIAVKTGLNPYIVATHFLTSAVLIALAVVMWVRAGEGTGPARPLVSLPIRQTAWLLTGLTAALLVVGTVVTGAGPHAGDARQVHRIPIDWERITQFHVDLVFLVVGLTVALALALRAVAAPAAARTRTHELLGVLLAQGVVGYVQYFTHLPEVLVGIHMLGASLVWVAVLRVVLALRERPRPEPGVPAPAGEDARLAPV